MLLNEFCLKATRACVIVLGGSSGGYSFLLFFAESIIEKPFQKLVVFNTYVCARIPVSVPIDGGTCMSGPPDSLYETRIYEAIIKPFVRRAWSSKERGSQQSVNLIRIKYGNFWSSLRTGAGNRVFGGNVLVIRVYCLGNP